MGWTSLPLPPVGRNTPVKTLPSLVLSTLSVKIHKTGCRNHKTLCVTVLPMVWTSVPEAKSVFAARIRRVGKVMFSVCLHVHQEGRGCPLTSDSRSFWGNETPWPLVLGPFFGIPHWYCQWSCLKSGPARGGDGGGYPQLRQGYPGQDKNTSRLARTDVRHRWYASYVCE